MMKNEKTNGIPKALLWKIILINTMSENYYSITNYKKRLTKNIAEEWQSD